MMRYKLLLFLILLPLLTKSKNVRPKRPHSYAEQEPVTQFPLIDQLALADNWKSPSRVISATYSGDPETGRVNHANLVINIVPRTNKKPANVDIIATQSLANAKTAEEYVNKALEMKHKYDHTTPSSSFVKYDIYEKEKTRRVPAYVTSTASPAIRVIDESNDAKNTIESIVGDTEKSSSDFHDYYHQPNYPIQSTITTTAYKNADDSNGYGSYKDSDGANTDFNHQLASTNYETFGTINNINFDNQKSFSNALQRVTGGSNGIYPSKQEVYDYIERAVKKYMRELESEGKLAGGVAMISGAPTAHAEIKTYYRFPSSTMSTPVSSSTKLYSMGTHSEFFKPAKSNSVKISGVYSTVKPFTVESYTPDTIDLTVRSKKRPKPIDLSALDVGQSWSHSASSEPGISYHHRKPHKPKLQFNSQSYHDINTLPYAPNRGIIYDEYTPSTPSYPDLANAHTSLSVKDHPVGASISFGGNNGGSAVSTGSYESDESSKTHHFTPSMQVVNGMPVTNPYKFNMDTLNDIFDTTGTRTKDSSSISDGEYGGTSVSWNPYNFDFTNLKESASGSGYPFDSYNPKFNNNPEGHGYQDSYKYSGSGEYDQSGDHYQRQRGTIGSDMYASGSSHRPKKISPSSSSSHQKRQPKSQKVKVKQRTSKRFSQHSRDLERDLTPPPAEY